MTGRFRITGLPAGRPLTLSVGSGMGLPGERERPLEPVEIENVRAGGDPLRVVLPFGGRIRGRIAGAAPGTRFRCHIYSRKISSGGSIRVEDGGAFLRDAPQPGVPFLLRIDHPDLAPLVVECDALASGEDLDLGELVFGDGHVLAGLVLGPDGDPVEGAEVKLVERWLDMSAFTDAGGRFRLDRLPARPIWARVLAKGLPSWFVVFDPPDRVPETTVRISRGAHLTIDVRDAEGAPAGSGTLGIIRDLEHRLDGDLDDLYDYLRLTPEGKLSLRLQPGRYRLRARSEDREQVRARTIEIAEDEERTLRIDLSPPR